MVIEGMYFDRVVDNKFYIHIDIFVIVTDSSKLFIHED